MKNIKTIELLKDIGTKEYYLFINNRYAMYLGEHTNAIYDTINAKDIPQYIFAFRELLTTLK